MSFNRFILENHFFILKHIIVLPIMFILSNLNVFSIDYNPEKLENILEKVSEESGRSPLLDGIEGLIENPVNLKTAYPAEFLQIPGFSTSEALKILKLSQSNDSITIDSIANKLLLNEEQRYLLTLCTTLKSQDNTKERYKKKYFYYRMRNKQQYNKLYGFENGNFLGNDLDFYQRINLYYKQYSIGILMDKDLGEKSLTDFTSGYMTGNLTGWNFILGDYYPEFGLGSLLWKTHPLRKGADVISPTLQYGRGFRPYRSTIDYHYFRGVALQNEIEFSRNSKLNLSFWLSNTQKPATIDTVNNIVTSVYTAGYYRTATEILKKNSLREQTTGLNLEWTLNKIKYGLTGYGISYDKSIESSAMTAFKGKSGILSSFYFLFSNDNYSFGSELSRDTKGKIGIKTGFQIETNLTGISFGFRSFPASYRSPYGYNFGESTAPANEVGLYSSLQWHGFKDIALSAYIDLYKTYTETHDVPVPVKGIDIFSECLYHINKDLLMTFRVKHETKLDALLNPDADEKLIFYKSRSFFRLNIEHSINKNFNVKIRIEGDYVNFESKKTDEFGISGFAEFIWSSSDLIKLGSRLTYFSIDSYDSAIWQFEAATPGYMATVPLYGSGMRAYIFTKIQPLEFITIWCRYSIIEKNNATNLGSDLMEIVGNKDKRMIIQCDIGL